MFCTTCHNELVMPGSRSSGLCNPCREGMTPKYIPDSQFDTYWGLRSERKNI